MIDSCIFDLDGVLVNTAKYHFQSWRKLTDRLGFRIDDAIEEKLKGAGRMDSLDIILDAGGYRAGAEERKELAYLKNRWYLESIEKMTAGELLPGVKDFLDSLRKRNIKMAIGSASKNALAIIRKVAIEDYFQVIIDGTMVRKSKPDPEVFMKAAEGLNARPDQIIVFEDSYKGIQAAKTGGFHCVGVGESQNLNNSDFVIPGFGGISFNEIIDKLKASKSS